MVTKFELIEGLVPIDQIRKLANATDDVLLRKLFAFVICEYFGGIREIPNKTHKIEIAKLCIEKNMSNQRIMDVLHISKSTIKRIKREARTDS